LKSSFYSKTKSLIIVFGRLAGPHEPGERFLPPGGLLFKSGGVMAGMKLTFSKKGRIEN
jgi:hypothetical protein